MPQYLIEREIPDAGKMTPGDLQGAAQHSNSVIEKLGPSIEWVHSYVAGDKIYCVYKSPDEDLIRKHAEQSGFPANKITLIAAVIDPSTANSVV